MKTLNSLLRDFCWRSRFLLGLGVAGLVGWQPAAAADASRRVPVRPVLRHTLPAGESAPTLPAGVTLVDWRQIRAEYERHRHGMFADGKGGYQSRSHYHGWLARFDGKGFVLAPDGEDWTWGLELVRWGLAGSEMQVSGAGAMEAKVNRLEYRRAGITEWFENGKEGLEHGFTVPRRPAGQGEELALEMRVRGGLEAVARESGATGLAYRRAGGGTVLRYRKLWVTDARGRRLEARMVAEEGLVRIVVRDQGAEYPITVDPLVQQAYLKASNPRANDWFGGRRGVAISGDTVVVGALNEDSNATGVNGNQSDSTAANAGAAYVFVRSGGTWTQQAYLKASNTGAGDLFGFCVSISGDTVMVAAPMEDSNAAGVNGDQSNNQAADSGALYVFTRSGSAWSQQAYLKASNPGADDRFGESSAVFGNTAVAGALREDSNARGVNGNQSNESASDAGAAYVFVRSGSTWTQQAYLKSSNSQATDNFGMSIAISVDTIVVGAWLEDSGATGVNGNQDDNSRADSGAAYVFVRSGTTWTQQAYLKASNPGTGDQFSWTVDISGDTVVVGSQSEDSVATGVNGDGSDDSATNSGAVYVFSRTGSTWSQQAYLKASNTDEGDQFGFSVSIWGDSLIVGAFPEDSAARGLNSRGQNDNSGDQAGAAYIFGRNGAVWSQQAYLKASNADAGDHFGISVATSGGVFVVGAWGEDSGTTGVNGDGDNNLVGNSGAAYLFADVVGGALTPTSDVVPASPPAGRTVMVTLPNGVAWTAVSPVSWITIVGGANGTGSGVVNYNVANNSSTSSRSATLTIAGMPLAVTQSGLGSSLRVSPLVVSVPSTGATGLTFNVSAGVGEGPWTAVSNSPTAVTITGGTSGTGSGVVTFNVAANSNTAGRFMSISVGPRTVNIYQAGTSPLTLSRNFDLAPMGGGAGRTVTVTAPAGTAWTATSPASWIVITGGASGTGNGVVTYTVRAFSGIGGRSNVITIGSQALMVRQTGPTPVGSGSIAGTGSSNTFTFRFSHSVGGVDRLGVVNVLINRALDGGRACYLAYSQPFQTLFLVDDNGPDAGLSALTLGGTGSVSNSQCTVNAAGSSATAEGDTLTLRLNIDFKPAFAGNHLIYLAAREDGPGGANSGWMTQGAWTVPGRPITYPRSLGMSPAAWSWSGNSVFSFTFEDQTSANNLQTAWVLMNTALDAAGACYVAYFVPGNLVLLFPDNGDGAQATAMELTGTNTVENSQCRISASGSTVTKSGGRLTLNLNMTPKSGLMGPQGVWMATQPLSGAASGWSALGNRIVQ
jgi:hypothetical protein